VAQFRFAVVLLEIFGREHEFPLGQRPPVILVRVVEDKHGQRPVHADGLVALGRIEHEPPAESADARLARLIEHGVGPDFRQPGGRVEFFFPRFPGKLGELGKLRLELERLAATQRHRQGGRDPNDSEVRKIKTHHAISFFASRGKR